MANLTVSNLVAIPEALRIVVTWSSEVQSDIDAVEIWAAETNDRSLAVHVGDGSPTNFVHLITKANSDFYYWVRGRDSAGSVGDWFPEAADAGIQVALIGGYEIPATADFSIPEGAQIVAVTLGDGAIERLSDAKAYSRRVIFIFKAVVTLVHSADLVLPGAINKVTEMDDIAMAVPLGSGRWSMKFIGAQGLPGEPGIAGQKFTISTDAPSGGVDDDVWFMTDGIVASLYKKISGVWTLMYPTSSDVPWTGPILI